VSDADLLIAGAGTAGLATAIFGAQAGLRCVVIDPGVGPQSKACGEGLLPSARPLLAALGVAPAPAVELHGLRYVRGGAVAEHRFRGAPGLGVQRVVLSAALRARAAALGVEFRRGVVRTFVEHAAGVEAAGCRARWLVAADGVRSRLRARLGVALAPPRWPRRIGLRQHFIVDDLAPFVEVHWHDAFEIYLTPVAPALLNVAVLGAPGLDFAACLAEAPALRGRLGPAADELAGAGPFGRWTRTQRVGRVLLVGDAAGFLDPLTGEGNRLAMASARALVDAVRANAPRTYPVAWRREARGYRLLTRALIAIASRPALRRTLVPLLRRAPWLLRLGLRLLEPRQPRAASQESIALVAGRERASAP
jgi:flavin-dependent dehydrogenase